MLTQLLNSAVREGSQYFIANWCFPLVIVHLLDGNCLPSENRLAVELNTDDYMVGLHRRFFDQSYIE